MIPIPPKTNHQDRIVRLKKLMSFDPSLSTVPLSHSHVFLGSGHEKNERRTWAVIALCGAMMVAEIIGGLLFGLSLSSPTAST
jgi:hypothetical protein